MPRDRWAQQVVIDGYKIGKLMSLTEAKGIDSMVGISFRSAVIRFFDILIAGLLLVISLPLWVFIAALIKLFSPGPVFYSHYRLGKDRAPFKLVKFRTMVVNAEENGPQWAQKDDQRVTSVGQILRGYHLDELPQLLSVLKGDLSMVGPRPIREQPANILQQHAPEYAQRFSVKPGLTGWAQIYAPYGSDIDTQLKKLPYDLKYLGGLSISDYFRILFLTAPNVLRARGC